MNQNGRSMIEMLGVLAIIGVLSVGGIAGYSKAMSKYRTNKTIDQVTQVINGVRTLYSGQKNYENISGRVLRKAKILPESAFESSTSDEAVNPFGGVIRVSATDRKTADDNRAVEMHLNNLPEDACLELATQDWGAGEGLYAVAIETRASGANGMEGCTGDAGGSPSHIACAGGSQGSLPISVSQATISCSGSNNSLYFYFY